MNQQMDHSDSTDDEATGDGEQEHEDVADDVLDSLSTENLTELIHGVSLEGPDGEPMTLADVIDDLAQSHEELDQYKRGALTMCSIIDERLQEAEAADADALAAVLRETKRTAFGVYLRVQRGDEELIGDRDGEYSGYFTVKGDPIAENYPEEDA